MYALVCWVIFLFMRLRIHFFLIYWLLCWLRPLSIVFFNHVLCIYWFTYLSMYVYIFSYFFWGVCYWIIQYWFLMYAYIYWIMYSFTYHLMYLFIDAFIEGCLCICHVFVCFCIYYSCIDVLMYSFICPLCSYLFI